MAKPEPTLADLLVEIRELRRELRAPARRLLTVPEAAAYLCLSSKTVRNRLGPKAAKPFPVKPVRLAGKVLFRLEALDAYIQGLEEGL